MLAKRLTLSLVAAGALTFAGCGSSGSSSSSSTPAPAATSSSASGAAAPASGAVAVSMKNIQFAPASVTVKVGQKITWTNGDDVDHNVAATGGATFKSPNFGKGGTYSYTAVKAGSIKYVCTIHPGMDGTITVQ